MPADWEPHEPLDLGDGHSLRFYGPADASGRPIGAIEQHPRPDTGEPCEGSVLFVSAPEPYRRQHGGEVWTVESWEPLTLSPSIQCTACGNHGYVRSGRWVPA